MRGHEGNSGAEWMKEGERVRKLSDLLIGVLRWSFVRHLRYGIEQELVFAQIRSGDVGFATAMC